MFDLQGDGTIPATLSDIPELRTSPLADFPDNNYQAGINLAVLLQSLDQDNMVENGIEIHPQTAALFDGVQLETTTWQFDTNGNLIREAKDENGDGIFETVMTKNYTPVSSWWELYLLDAGWAMVF